MRRTRGGICCLAAAIVAWAGCHTADSSLKPPLHEEYILPPTDDARFSSPPTYPKDSLDNAQFKKEQLKPGERFSGPGRMGPGMGGGMQGN
jgi:hypothetical protein